MKKYYNSLILIGILILVNLLSYKFFYRFDMTSDHQFTLSNATKNILKSLDDPVTITAYFSKNLPPDIQKTREDFRDMLEEYAGISGGMVEYRFVDPSSDKDKEQEALQSGIRPVMIKVREKDEIKQQKSFLGATISLDERKEIIPFIKPGAPLEYELSTAIKKVSIENKPPVAILSGHGEPGLDELSQVEQSLSILYNPETVDLKNVNEISPKYKVALLIAPKDSFDTGDLQKLDKFLSGGGNLVLAINSVEGDFQNSRGVIVNTGIENWLQEKGLNIEHKFVVDFDCGTVSVQQKQGYFTMVNQVKFPFLPIIRNFADHTITKGIEEVILKFASPMKFIGDSTVNFVELATTSDRSGVVDGNTYFDVINKKWTSADFNRPNIPVAGILEGKLAGDVDSKMVVYSDGDFAVTGKGRNKVNDNNISFLVNAVDWLGDDTGLIELRTKGVVSRPIEQKYLTEDASGKRSLIKYLNFGLPILLVILIGIFMMQRRKAIRIKRMQEEY
ncbi:MAG TPA: hypothetical protein ENI82_03015 [Bacteroidetes bacterium]|nr:hypothetical protein [Bacteroidota bacterium]